MTYGEKLKHIRKNNLGLTQTELAESIHFTQTAIERIENGKVKDGSFELLRQLVLVHHVNPYYFIYEKTNEPPILKRTAIASKSILQKISKYENLIDELMAIKRGK